MVICLIYTNGVTELYRRSEDDDGIPDKFEILTFVCLLELISRYLSSSAVRTDILPGDFNT